MNTMKTQKTKRGMRRIRDGYAIVVEHSYDDDEAQENTNMSPSVLFGLGQLE